MRGAPWGGPPFHQPSRTHQSSGYARITDEEAAVGRARDPHKGRHPRRTNGVADVRRLLGLSSRSGGGAKRVESSPVRLAGVFLMCLSRACAGLGRSRRAAAAACGRAALGMAVGGWMLVAAFVSEVWGLRSVGRVGEVAQAAGRAVGGAARRGYGYVGWRWRGAGTRFGRRMSRWARRRWRRA